jgi:two-component system sensor histidine kinase/response regulator
VVENDREPGTRILVIDDERGMREGCRRALSPLGYTVETASNLTAGLQQIQSQPYDLFLLDVMLPDGSGLDLIDPILGRDANAICIIITGFATIELAVEAIRQGAFDFLSKPFTSDELIVAVNQGLERRRLKAVEAQAQELARAKENLEKLDEMKTRFMLTVAHELRAPVASIQSYVNLILADYVSEEEMEQTLARTQVRLQELLDLIEDLLSLARLKEVGDLPVIGSSPEPAADILQEVCDLLREQAQEKEQTFRVQIQDHPNIVIQRDHLRQVWTNLISNAIKYTPQGGQITVSLRTANGRLIGTVEDSGIGIAAKDLGHLFQEFFRTDQAKATGEIGTGLGLSIVKQILDSYQGEIHVRSGLGKGTRFTFSLPLEPQGAKPEAEPTSESAPSPTDVHRQPVPPAALPPSFVLDDDLAANEQG